MIENPYSGRLGKRSTDLGSGYVFLGAQPHGRQQQVLEAYKKPASIAKCKAVPKASWFY